jgi:hypothetical protein
MKYKITGLRKIFFKGEANMFIIAILGAVVATSFLLVGGVTPSLKTPDAATRVVEPNFPSDTREKRNSLQLQTFGYVVAAPTTTPSPVPTEPPQACLNNTAINLLVDLSYSMQNGSKDVYLRNALGVFRQSLQPNTVIGIQAFGAYRAWDILPFTQYGGNETRVQNGINSLTPGSTGGTFMKSGYDLALSKIRPAKTTYPNYRFVTILFSDGVPEVSGHAGTQQCIAEYNVGTYVCFAKSQDPRQFGLDGVMKQEVDKVYSVAIYDPNSGRDAYMIPHLRDLLRDVASGRETPYYQETTTANATQLTPIFQSIIKGICS